MNEKPHIIFITETKLKAHDVSAQFFDCNTYTVYRKDRDAGQGGGVAILVRRDLISSQIQDATWEQCETVACMLNMGTNNVLLCCIYRSGLRVIIHS